VKAAQYVVRDSEGHPAGVAKLHLREEPDGRGILVINANKVLYLNKTATHHVRLVLEGLGTEAAVKALAKRYRAKREDIRKHHEHILTTIDVLIKSREVDPFMYLGVDKTTPFQEELNAPLRMDLALTYRCQNNCLHCYAKGPHETRELTTEQWRLVLRKLYEAQIPAVSFTGGEPTLREDLADLVAATQSIGLVSGLITNGRRLSDKGYAERLYRAGLDFVQITLESNRPEVHERMTRAPGSWKETVEGIRSCLGLGLYVTTNTTLSPYNVDHALELVHFLKELDVVNFAMNALIYSGRGEDVEKDFVLPRETLRRALDEVKHEAFLLGMSFNWYSPTRYCELNPVTMGLGAKFCSACRTNMAVEPDGTVLPCQSWFKSVGNILADPWDKIWNHELCVYIRKRGWLEQEEKCRECDWRTICGAACPLEAEKKRILHTECSVT